MPSKKPSVISQLPIQNWHSLAWSLLLLTAVRKSGVEEASSVVLHRLQYFSNSLAPIYKAKPPHELVMKLKRGPFYPDAQDDLDTLCICGLATIRNTKWHRQDGRAWKTALYGLTSRGYEVAGGLVANSSWCEDVSAFLHDLVLAYGDITDAVADEVVFADLTYGQHGTLEGDVIPFNRADQNLSVRATVALSDFLPKEFAPNRRNQLRMYLRYLEGMAA